MSSPKRDEGPLGANAPRLHHRSDLALGLVLCCAIAACTYQPLSEAEKAGFDAAGAGAKLGEDTTSGSNNSSLGGSSSGNGGNGGDTGVCAASESSVGTSSAGAGGTGGGGSVASGGTLGSGGAEGSSTTGTMSGSGGASGTAGTTGTSGFRYVRLVASSSQNGNPFTAVAEFELLDGSGQLLDNAIWTASADSEETVDEVAPVSQAIDGDIDTFWHTEWGDVEAPLPHYLQIDLGTAEEITGFVYTPRQDGGQNGWILDWELYLSNSESAPGTPVLSGSFASGTSPQTVNLP